MEGPKGASMSKRLPTAVSAYMAEIGAKGGKAKGKRKVRPSAHYKTAAAKRWAKAHACLCPNGGRGWSSLCPIHGHNAK